jgi:hypothetical protein
MHPCHNSKSRTTYDQLKTVAHQNRLKPAPAQNGFGGRHGQQLKGNPVVSPETDSGLQLQLQTRYHPQLLNRIR